jgi:hypothetical protein
VLAGVGAPGGGTGGVLALTDSHGDVLGQFTAGGTGVLGFPLLRVDPAQMPRLEEIHANLGDRLQEAREQGWLGEVAAIEATLAAAA